MGYKGVIVTDAPTGKLPVAIPTANNIGILRNIGYGLSYTQ